MVNTTTILFCFTTKTGSGEICISIYNLINVVTISTKVKLHLLKTCHQQQFSLSV